MSSKDRVGKRLSPFRILLLVALGGSAGLGFTAPGKWVALELSSPLRPRPPSLFPQWLEVASGAESRWCETLRAVRDMHCDTDDPAAPRTVPTPALVADRLTGIDGWSTAVLFESGSSPSELRAAGLQNDLACVHLARGNPFLLGHRNMPGWDTSGPIRDWRLVLLDDRGRQVASVFVTALRGGFTPGKDPQAGNVFVEDPGAPGDAELPAVCVFHRTADGQVITG